MPTALTESRLINGIGLSKTRREEHLKGTAELAASFAAEFGCGEWGCLAGLRHEKLKVSLSLPCLNDTVYLRCSPAKTQFYHVMKNNKYHSKYAFGSFEMNYF